MNDEEMVTEAKMEENAETGDPIPSEVEESREDAEPLAVADENAPAVSDDPCQDPDSGASETSEAPETEQLEQLRGELTRLRAELAERDAFLSRIGNDCTEFQQLYPKTALSELPDEVWQDVKRGIPIAAAFALSERKRTLAEEKATLYNRDNERRSSGALEATAPDYFSPAEVRSMTPGEVRANYQKIMQSMQKWH